MTYNPNVPTRITLTIANAQRAVEYWLNQEVLRETVRIKEVAWHERENVFVVDIYNNTETDETP